MGEPQKQDNHHSHSVSVIFANLAAWLCNERCCCCGSHGKPPTAHGKFADVGCTRSFVQLLFDMS